MKYIPTIGLEIHAELKTASKMFCSCKNDPEEEIANKNICPICMGHPGTLPVLNHDAIRKVLSIGIAVDGKIADFTEWDRKNYFYPDIPKGYQISQYKFPLVSGGALAGVDLERIHLEEDTAQSTHDTHEKTLINFNRSGVPLMELVTKPVIHDAETAVCFAKELQLLLHYLDASDANMEKGEMRVEANISIASEEDTLSGKLGTKTEVKNLNSFKSVEHAITFEIERQTSLLERGEHIAQETRGWDETKSETFSQRSKESSHDYRYFPEPDIPKMKISEISEFGIDVLRSALPELPWKKRDRYITSFGMTMKEVAIFIESPKIANYYESVISSYKTDANKIKLTTNYLLSDYIGLLKKEHATSDVGNHIERIASAAFAALIEMISCGELSSRGAKDLIPLMMANTTQSPKLLAEKHGLIQNSSVASIEPAIDKVISDNKSIVDEYRGGKTASLQYLIGQTMKATKGSANPTVIKELLLKKLH